MKPIYLDFNATTPIAPSVAAAMRPFLTDNWGNPSSQHIYGTAAQTAVAEARAGVASMLGCRSGEIVFTSGGSESNNMAIKGAAYARRHRGNHIITSQVEHPAVSEVCRYLETQGFRVSDVPVDATGRVAVDDVAAAITSETILITIMHANNEVGTVQPIAEIAALARKKDILLHTDAAQSAGKIPVDVAALDVDLLSIAGHKFYAHKGIGALYIKDGLILEKFIHGAAHERNRRAGTENTLQMVGLAEACRLVGAHLLASAAHMLEMRDLLHRELRERVPDIHLNGHPAQRLPNTLNISFGGCDAGTILSNLPGVAASAGAACHAGETRISATLAAMDVPLAYARGAIRFSTGRTSTREEMLLAAERIAAAVTLSKK